MFSLADTIIAFGYIGIFLAVFAESGFLFGFFLPGDSLLFTLGLLASQGVFNIILLVTLVVFGAILGDNFGYYIGKKFGPKIFTRDDSLFFKKEYTTKTEKYYQKYGKKTIIIARFIPIVRTFAPIAAGIARMHYGTFFVYNIIGGILWGAGVPLIAYTLGVQFPWIKDYLEYIILGIITTSFIPVIIDLMRAYRKNNARG